MLGSQVTRLQLSFSSLGVSFRTRWRLAKKKPVDAALLAMLGAAYCTADLLALPVRSYEAYGKLVRMESRVSIRLRVGK